MKTKVLACFMLFLCANLIAQGPFEKIYSTSRDRALRDVLKTSDGGYILCGWTNAADPTECDVFILRTDINGNELAGWPKVYGKSGNSKVDFAYSMVETSDGNFFVLGYSSSYGGGDIDVYLLKISPDGSEIFTKTFGGNGFDEGREIIKSSDNNYVIVGSTTIGGNQQAFLMKIDVNGNTLWSPGMQTFGGSNKDFGNAVAETSDGSFIFTGQTMDNDLRGDAFVIKTNSGGLLDWQQIIGEPLADEGTGIVVNSDGSSVVCIRDSTSQSDINVRVRKLSNLGVPVQNYNWSFGGFSKDTPKCLTHSKDGNYYLGAISRSWNWRGNSAPDSPDMWLLKINAATGDTIWSRNFGQADHDHLEQVKPDPLQDGILLCGHSVGQPYVKRPYFLKINAYGRLDELSTKNLEGDMNVKVGPNPFSDCIHFSEMSALKCRVVLADITGKVVLETQITKDNSDFILSTQHLPAGLYLVKFESNEKLIVMKVLKYQ